MSRLTKEERAKLDNLPHTQFGEIERLVPRALRALDAAEAREKELEKACDLAQRFLGNKLPPQVTEDWVFAALRAALAKETDHG